MKSHVCIRLEDRNNSVTWAILFLLVKELIVTFPNKCNTEGTKLAGLTFSYNPNYLFIFVYHYHHLPHKANMAVDAIYYINNIFLLRFILI